MLDFSIGTLLNTLGEYINVFIFPLGLILGLGIIVYINRMLKGDIDKEIERVLLDPDNSLAAAFEYSQYDVNSDNDEDISESEAQDITCPCCGNYYIPSKYRPNTCISCGGKVR